MWVVLVYTPVTFVSTNFQRGRADSEVLDSYSINPSVDKLCEIGSAKLLLKSSKRHEVIDRRHENIVNFVLN